MRGIRTFVTALAAVIALAGGARAQGLEIVDAVFDGQAGADGLEATSAIALSPDGEHLYSVSFLEGVVVTDVDPLTGALDFVENIRDGDGGANNLASPRDVAVSPDGKHVYVVALTDGAVTAFSRSAVTGKLTFVQDRVKGVDVPTGLAGARAVTVSPDGGHVYVVSTIQDSIVAFSRNSTDGTLTLVGVHLDNEFGVDGLESARDVTVSPDGKHVYVAAGDSLNFTGDEAVSIFSRDAVTGALSFEEAIFDGQGGARGIEAAATVCVSPDGKHLYVGNDLDITDDLLAVYSRNENTGALDYVETVGLVPIGDCPLPIAFTGETGVAISPDGLTVFVTQTNPDSVLAFPRDERRGTLGTPATSVCTAIFDGLFGAAGCTATPNGKFVLVGAFGDNAVTSLEVLSPYAVTGFTPATGTAGTILTVSGRGFSRGKPFVTVGGAKLKTIKPVTDGEFRALLKKPLPPGLYSVIVNFKIKGVAPVEMPASFSFAGPVITGVQPGQGAANARITVTGLFFGLKKGKVLLVPDAGGKALKGKVDKVTWTMDPATGASSFDFLVPKKAIPGTYVLTLVTKMGQATFNFTVP